MFSLIEIDSVLSPARRKLFHYFWVTFALLLIFSTWKLWGGQTLYPQVPFLPFCTSVPHQIDEILRGLVCLSLVVMLLTNEESSFWRWGCLGFIIGMLGLFLLDQHRLQPWAWQFVLIAVATLLFRSRPGLPGDSSAFWWRWLAISIYFFSALSKFDLSFADELGSLFLQKVGRFVKTDVTRWSILWQRVGALSFPAWELLTGLLLCFRKTRLWGVWAAWFMHIELLLILGPTGLNHHAGVLLWNGFFICQAGLLFWPCRYREPACLSPISETTHFRRAQPSFRAVLFSLILLLPLLEPFGLYDHWPAWGLYASHAERVSLQIQADDREKLPFPMQSELTQNPNDPLWYRVRLDRWSLDGLHAPIYPQGRFQLGVAAAVIDRFGLKDRFQLSLESPATRTTKLRYQEEFWSRVELQKRLESFRFNGIPRKTPLYP